MKFLIITHVVHKLQGKRISAYAPYVREMNLWIKHVDEVILVAPAIKKNKSVIELSYNHDCIRFKSIPAIAFTNVKEAVFSLIKIPLILLTIFKACIEADHIHLRCPGNIGLLGCFVQIFFPNKVKTAKYAGNWNPEARNQPKSYKIQKWLLSNTFLTKKMTTLVYGNWKNQTKNIKSFFTATYRKEEIVIPRIRDYTGRFIFIFAGGLVEGKRPFLAIQIIENLIKNGYLVELHLYGDGLLKPYLKNYITNNNLDDYVTLWGNQGKDTLKKAFQNAHFLILPSKSEGWPKVLAEAMFFGTIPISTSVSCVPFMLDYGNRGILIDPNLEVAVKDVLMYLNNGERLKLMAENAFKWSQKYTLDTFETEIVKLLKG